MKPVSAKTLVMMMLGITVGVVLGMPSAAGTPAPGYPGPPGNPGGSDGQDDDNGVGIPGGGSGGGFSECSVAPVLHEDFKITASDGASGDRFGWPVAISGDVAIVGAWNDDTAAGSNAGSAYIYHLDLLTGGNSVGWVEEARLFASDGAAGDLFGWRVEIEGDVAVVSAKFDDTVTGGVNAGSVYVFRYDGNGGAGGTGGWSEEQHLFASQGAAADEYGVSISLSGDRLIVGAPTNNEITLGSTIGSAYVYKYTGSSWREEVHLFASDGADYDQFGLSVALSGNLALVGAYTDDTAGGVDAGSAYVYRRKGSGWVEEAHLFAADGEAGDWYGVFLDIDGETAIIGARHDNTAGGFNSGSAYVYRFQGKFWSEEAHLMAIDGAGGDEFGISVVIQENIAIVGSRRDDTAGGVDTGSAYVYRFNSQTGGTGGGWVEHAHLFASDGAPGDEFGLSVALSEKALIMGAWGDDAAGGSSTGSVYCFSRDCNNNGIVDLIDLADHASPDVNANAVPDECDCLADIIPIVVGGPNGNGVVNLDDMIQVLNNMGQSTLPCEPTLPGDINYNGIVNFDDLMWLLINFGPCP